MAKQVTDDAALQEIFKKEVYYLMAPGDDRRPLRLPLGM